MHVGDFPMEKNLTSCGPLECKLHLFLIKVVLINVTIYFHKCVPLKVRHILTLKTFKTHELKKQFRFVY